MLEAHFAEAPSIDLKNYEKYIKAGKQAAKNSSKSTINRQNKNPPKVTKTNTSDKDQQQKSEQISKLSPDQEQEIYYQHILRELVVNIRPSIAELLLGEKLKLNLKILRSN